MTVNLADQSCTSCSSKTPPLDDSQCQLLLTQLTGWEIAEQQGIKQLKRAIKAKDFQQALELANSIGALAETENHHPQLSVEWGCLTVIWWTHSISGLHNNDFILAAKTDQLISR